jgi:hypothetical protein
MNSLPGGASVPNAAPSPNTPSTAATPSPQPDPHRPRCAHCGCGRHVSRPPAGAEPGMESAPRAPHSRPALAPSRGPRPPVRWTPRPRSGRPRPGPARPGPAHRRTARRPPPPPGFRRASSPSRTEPHPSFPELPPPSTFRTSLRAPSGGGEKSTGKRSGVSEAVRWRSSGAGGVWRRGGEQFQGSATFVRCWGSGETGPGRYGPFKIHPLPTPCTPSLPAAFPSLLEANFVN